MQEKTKYLPVSVVNQAYQFDNTLEGWGSSVQVREDTKASYLAGDDAVATFKVLLYAIMVSLFSTNDYDDDDSPVWQTSRSIPPLSRAGSTNALNSPESPANGTIEHSSILYQYGRETESVMRAVHPEMISIIVVIELSTWTTQT